MMRARTEFLDDRHVHDTVVVHAGAIIDAIPSASKSLARPGQANGLVRIGARTEVMPYAIVHRGAEIGTDCLIGDHACVREGARIGNRCVIGRLVTVHFNAEIDDDVRIMTGAHIPDGCRIGRGSFIGVNVTICGDRRREVVDYEFVGSDGPVIGENVLIGSGAVIMAGVRIGDRAVIGAGALVTSNIPAEARCLGKPSPFWVPEIEAERQMA